MAFAICAFLYSVAKLQFPLAAVARSFVTARRIRRGGAMHTLERFVYDIVKNNARLKMRLVRAYQTVCGVVPQSPLRTTLPIEVRDGYFVGNQYVQPQLSWHVPSQVP